MSEGTTDSLALIFLGQLGLALMYANGRGTARDLSTAMYWCLVALRTATEDSDKNVIAPTCRQLAAYFDALTLQGIRREAAAFQPLPHE